MKLCPVFAAMISGADAPERRANPVYAARGASTTPLGASRYPPYACIRMRWPLTRMNMSGV
jgi:hypothetical protein